MKEVHKTNRFIECGENTIYDTLSGLIWLKKDTYQITGKWMNWVQTRDFIEQQNRIRLDGYGDWRFPTPPEAKSLYEKSNSNKDYTGQKAGLPNEFLSGFGFLCWTSEVRNKIQAVRFGYRKGAVMYDDIYRVSRGSTRLVRNVDKNFSL